MLYDCISVRFRDGTPNVNFQEPCTVHALSPEVKAPRRHLKAGDVVLIKSPGYPLVKMLCGAHPGEYNGPKGGDIVGKAAFFDPVDGTTPFADMNTTQGGLAPA